MAVWGPTAIAADSDDGNWNAGNSTWFDRTNEGDIVGERFSVDKNDPFHCYGVLRFLNVAVPKDATINSATLTLWIVAGPSADAQKIITVFADRGDNRQDAPSASHHPPSTAWTNTTASVQVASPVTQNAREVTVTSIVQELVNLAGWASGDDICFNLDPLANGTNGYWICHIADYDLNYESYPSAQPATLTIDYTAGGSNKVRMILDNSVSAGGITLIHET